VPWVTTSRLDTSGQPAHTDERAELARVLESETFIRSPKVSRLLAYLCEKYFQGEAGEIKEYSIAVDALGRDPGFDPQHDAIVRVETYHLRKRLKQYYAAKGRNNPLRIVLPPGQYQPAFVPQTEVVIGGPRQGRENSNSEMWRRGLTLTAAIAVLIACSLVIFARGAFLRHAGAAAAMPIAGLSLSDSGAIRILAGDRSGEYIDKAGRVWLPDRFFHGGATFYRGPIPIRRTQDPEIYQTGREGNFTYDIPLAPGVYELHLYFAETGRVGEALRGINIVINGTPLSTLDIASDAGEVNTATMKVYKDLSPANDGFLHITFQSSDPGFLNALEILPGLPGKIRPLRLTTRNTAYRDHAGQIWLPDSYFAGGRQSMRVVALGPTLDPQLYEAQRFGHFTYSIPVAETGRYTMALHFIENWFGQLNAGGPKSRVFNVYCNGTTLLKDFDILRETGGSAGPLIKVFRDTEPSPQGKLDLTFDPIVNFATVSAIEVIQQ